MTSIKKLQICIAAACMIATAIPAMADDTRTAGRTVAAYKFNNKPVNPKPTDYSDVLPQFWDAKDSHPAQWEGMDWDPKLWHSDKWTCSKAMKRFFDNGVFKRRTSKKGKLIVEVGPMFHKLSDLDQRRSLKLLGSHFKVFENGHLRYVVRDGQTKKTMGYVTKDGVSLY